MALPVLAFLVGGAAIGGVVVLARHANQANGSQDKPGNAEPPPIQPGSVDLSGYQNANSAGGSMPAGTVVQDGAGGQPAGGGLSTGGLSSSVGITESGHPVQVDPTIEGGLQISMPPGGPIPGGPPQVVVDPAPINAVHPKGVMTAFNSLTRAAKTTKADVTNAYAEYGSQSGMVL